MSDRATPRRTADRIQLIAIIVVTLLVMVLGVLVVAFPRQMGVPQQVATPVTTTTATPAP